MTSTMNIPVETTKRCDGAKIKVGDVYSRHSFGKIIAIDRHRDMATVRNSNGNDWSIGIGILELEFTIAEQFEAEESLSRSAIIELMLDHPRTAMTINFNKKPKHTDAAKMLAEGQGSLTAKAWNAKVKTAMSGEERTMVGYHNRSFDEHQRLKFQESDKGQRLVDPRTINWVVLNRVRFVVSK